MAGTRPAAGNSPVAAGKAAGGARSPLDCLHSSSLAAPPPPNRPSRPTHLLPPPAQPAPCRPPAAQPAPAAARPSSPPPAAARCRGGAARRPATPARGTSLQCGGWTSAGQAGMCTGEWRRHAQVAVRLTHVCQQSAEAGSTAPIPCSNLVPSYSPSAPPGGSTRCAYWAGSKQNTGTTPLTPAAAACQPGWSSRRRSRLSHSSVGPPAAAAAAVRADAARAGAASPDASPATARTCGMLWRRRQV